MTLEVVIDGLCLSRLWHTTRFKAPVDCVRCNAGIAAQMLAYAVRNILDRLTNVDDAPLFIGQLVHTRTCIPSSNSIQAAK